MVIGYNAMVFRSTHIPNLIYFIYCAITSPCCVNWLDSNFPTPQYSYEHVLYWHGQPIWLLGVDFQSKLRVNRKLDFLCCCEIASKGCPGVVWLWITLRAIRGKHCYHTIADSYSDVRGEKEGGWSLRPGHPGVPEVWLPDHMFTKIQLDERGVLHMGMVQNRVTHLMIAPKYVGLSVNWIGRFFVPWK